MEIDRRIQLEFYILSNVKDYITINKIAKRINISDRTLKNDLIDLREYVKESGGELIAKPGKGLKINIIDEKKFKEADVNDLKSLFTGHGSYGSHISRTSVYLKNIATAASASENKAASYLKNGSYSALMSNYSTYNSRI